MRLFLKPLLSFLVLARGTMSIAAGAPDPVRTPARAALVDQRPQISGPAACQGAEHLALLPSDSVCVLFDKRTAMLPQTIRDSDHRA